MSLGATSQSRFVSREDDEAVESHRRNREEKEYAELKALRERHVERTLKSMTTAYERYMPTFIKRKSNVLENAQGDIFSYDMEILKNPEIKSLIAEGFPGLKVALHGSRIRNMQTGLPQRKWSDLDVIIRSTDYAPEYCDILRKLGECFAKDWFMRRFPDSETPIIDVSIGSRIEMTKDWIYKPLALVYDSVPGKALAYPPMSIVVPSHPSTDLRNAGLTWLKDRAPLEKSKRVPWSYISDWRPDVGSGDPALDSAMDFVERNGVNLFDIML